MHNYTYSMQEYLNLMEELQLTEEQQKVFSEFLTEEFTSKLGKTALVGFLKIVKALWDAGWYTVLHPIKTVKNVVRTTKYAIGAGITAGTAYGAYALKPYVDEAYMLWQLGQRFTEIVGQIKLTSPSTWKAAIESIRSLPNLANWTKLSIEQKVEIMNQLGLSSNAYGDLLRYVFDIASKFALDNAWVILALSLTAIAARFVSKFVSNKLDTAIKSIQGKVEPEKLIPDRIEPTLDKPQQKQGP